MASIDIVGLLVDDLVRWEKYLSAMGGTIISEHDGCV